MEGCEMGLWVLYTGEGDFGPTSVVGITTSMIAYENGTGNSLGGVASS